MDFSKFDEKFDLEGLKNDIKEANENSGNYKEVPLGSYEVKIEKLELTLSNTDENGNIKDKNKDQKPMVRIWFKILEGEFKGSLIFYNQLVTEGFQLNIMNEFLNSLDSGVDVYFESFNQYKDMILDIHEAIDGKLEYLLEYDKNNKGYSTYKIEEVYEVA